MAQDQYTFVGNQVTGYLDYTDTSTGQMLVAEPGESYGVRAVNEGAAVPPDDGRWETAEAPKALPAAKSTDQKAGE